MFKSYSRTPTPKSALLPSLPFPGMKTPFLQLLRPNTLADFLTPPLAHPYRPTGRLPQSRQHRPLDCWASFLALLPSVRTPLLPPRPSWLVSRSSLQQPEAHTALCSKLSDLQGPSEEEPQGPLNGPAAPVLEEARPGLPGAGLAVTAAERGWVLSAAVALMAQGLACRGSSVHTEREQALPQVSDTYRCSDALMVSRMNCD